MKKRYARELSLEELAALPDEAIDTSDIPELGDEFFRNAKLVMPAGKRRLLRIVVDGDGPNGTGPLLDDIAEATKALSVALDESEAVGASPYTLEVSSRGVSRPLELPRHWRRNVGRLVTVSTTAGESFTVIQGVGIAVVLAALVGGQFAAIPGRAVSSCRTASGSRRGTPCQS